MVSYNCTTFVDDIIEEPGLNSDMESHKWVIPDEIKYKFFYVIGIILKPKKITAIIREPQVSKSERDKNMMDKKKPNKAFKLLLFALTVFVMFSSTLYVYVYVYGDPYYFFHMPPLYKGEYRITR